MPKAKFKIPEIPKTFPSREEKEAVVKALHLAHVDADASRIALAAKLSDATNHFNQVAAALSAARNTRISAKKSAK